MPFAKNIWSQQSLTLTALLGLALAILIGYYPSWRTTETPEGCRKLPTDRDWPTQAEWEHAITGITREHCLWKCADYRIQARNYTDVQNAIRFASQNNIRVSIIASGHDFFARNTAASGVLIDVSQLRNIRLQESFVPSRYGVPSPRSTTLNQDVNAKPGMQAAVTFGPSFTGQQLNNILSPNKFMAIGGVHSSVCLAGGWGQMGGVGPFTHLFGLGVDQWLEAKIVTPDGQLKVANEVINQDLFWAIRGGGGGTFGVVVEATMKVYPEEPIGVVYWWMSSQRSGLIRGTLMKDSAMAGATRMMFGQLEPLLRKGVSGMLYGSANGLSGVANFFGKNSTRSHMHATMEPILHAMESIPGMNKFQSQSFNFNTYKEYYTSTFGPEHAPYKRPRSKGLVPMGGSLIDHESLTHPDIMKAFSRRYTGPGGQWAITVGSPGMSRGNGEDTSVNPGWRNAVGQVLLLNSDGVQKFAKKIGLYGNEATLNQKDWKEAFWGHKYAKLSTIKDKYDPQMLLWSTPGINADKMEIRHGRVCKSNGQDNGDVVQRSDNPAYMGIWNLMKLSQYTEILGARPAYPKYVGLEHA